MTYREAINAAFKELGVDFNADNLLAQYFEESGLDIDASIPFGHERDKVLLYKSLISQRDIGTQN